MSTKAELEQVVSGTFNESDASLEALSRSQLEQEIVKLRKTLAKLEAETGTKTDFGFLRENPFMERANEEFARSRRYSSPLTVVVLTILGYERIHSDFGKAGCDHYVAKLAEKCTNACRQGVDILGLIEQNQFAILLPEADLTGCTRFKERLKSELSESKITWNDTPVKSGMKISAGVLLNHDRAFSDLLKRTITQTAILPENSSAAA